MTTREFDEYVRRECGRFTPQEQARTGYHSMMEFNRDLYSTIRNPLIQAKAGVEEIAYMTEKMSPDRVLKNIEHGRATEGGTITDFSRFGKPNIAEGKYKYVRLQPMYAPLKSDPDTPGTSSGAYVPPTDPGASSDNPLADELMEKLANEQRMRRMEQEHYEKKVNMADARVEVERMTADKLKEYVRRTYDRMGLLGRGVSRQRLASSGFDKTYTEVLQVPATQVKDYIIERFFDNDPELLADWVVQTREEQGRRSFPDPRRDLFGAGDAPEASGSGIIPEPPAGEPPEAPSPLARQRSNPFMVEEQVVEGQVIPAHSLPPR